MHVSRMPFWRCARIGRRSFPLATWAAATMLLGQSAFSAPRQPAAGPSESQAAALSITQFRKASGLGPVSSDPQLVAAARTHAETMARSGVMSHDIGGSFPSRVRQAGIRAGYVSENVAMGQTSLQEVMASWKASSGHRANLLSRTATRIGLARTGGAGGRQFWALILASPEPRPGQPPQGEYQWGSSPPWLGLFGGKP